MTDLEKRMNNRKVLPVTDTTKYLDENLIRKYPSTKDDDGCIRISFQAIIFFLLGLAYATYGGYVGANRFLGETTNPSTLAWTAQYTTAFNTNSSDSIGFLIGSPTSQTPEYNPTRVYVYFLLSTMGPLVAYILTAFWVTLKIGLNKKCPCSPPRDDDDNDDDKGSGKRKLSKEEKLWSFNHTAIFVSRCFIYAPVWSTTLYVLGEKSYMSQWHMSVVGVLWAAAMVMMDMWAEMTNENEKNNLKFSTAGGVTAMICIFAAPGLLIAAVFFPIVWHFNLVSKVLPITAIVGVILADMVLGAVTYLLKLLNVIGWFNTECFARYCCDGGMCSFAGTWQVLDFLNHVSALVVVVTFWEVINPFIIGRGQL